MTASLRPTNVLDFSDKAELTRHFNTQTGWERILINALKNREETVIDAFKDSVCYSDEYMFELCLISGRFDMAQFYYDVITSNPVITIFEVVTFEECQKIRVDTIKNGYNHLRLIPFNKITCDLEEVMIFIDSLHETAV